MSFSIRGSNSARGRTVSVTQIKITVAGQLPGRQARRVREEVKDGLAVIAFSATASSALAVALMLFVHLVD